MLDRAEKILEPLAASGCAPAWRRCASSCASTSRSRTGRARSACSANSRRPGARRRRARSRTTTASSPRLRTDARRPRRGARATARGAPRGAALPARGAGASGHRDRAAGLCARGAPARRRCSPTMRRSRSRCIPRLVRLARAAGPAGEAAVARVVDVAAGCRQRSGNRLDHGGRARLHAARGARARAAWRGDDAIAGLVRAIGRDPATLDARAVADVARGFAPPCGDARRAIAAPTAASRASITSGNAPAARPGTASGRCCDSISSRDSKAAASRRLKLSRTRAIVGAAAFLPGL